MPSDYLNNLVRIGKLKSEPPDQNQFAGMIQSAKIRLADLKVEGLSEEGQFLSAYGAAHLLSLAALRWHGYRSDNRYLVFQCLQHTTDFGASKWRVLANCHNLRNLAEYEGVLEISPRLLQELIELTQELLALVEALGPVE